MKKDENTKKKSTEYPVELPSRNGEVKHSPIIDVVEQEIYPLEFANCHKSSPRFNDSITEVVATEIAPETAEQTIHEQHM